MRVSLYATSFDSSSSSSSKNESKKVINGASKENDQSNSSIPMETQDALKFFFGGDPATTKEITRSREKNESKRCLGGSVLFAIAGNIYIFKYNIKRTVNFVERFKYIFF